MRKKKIRKVLFRRKTQEVDIKGEFNIDGIGKVKVNTGIGALDHLLTLFAFHGLFDLKLEAKGDLHHHLVEDIGIVIGKAIKDALGDKFGINRYGSFSIVMDKVLVEANVDISGRPSLHGVVTENCSSGVLSVDDFLRSKNLINQGFDNTSFTFKHAQEFLEALVNHSGISFIYNI
ncbi:MAG: hypothetical protein NC820_04925, partial [Candidatus Omnitrophica bacterium]|nr:hypothetical protein [Candidatus Omnitrophota bacterium]